MKKITSILCLLALTVGLLGRLRQHLRHGCHRRNHCRPCCRDHG